MADEKKKNPASLDNRPDLIYRPVFVQGIRVQKCRFNPSFERFQRLPQTLQKDLIRERIAKHGDRLPPFEISRPKSKR